MKPVTTYTATVQTDLEKALPLYQSTIESYRTMVKCTGDSLWLTIQWAGAGTVGFRMAFAMGCAFENAQVLKRKDHLIIKAKTVLAQYSIVLKLPQKKVDLIRYTTTIRLDRPLLIPFSPRDIFPLTKDGLTENTTGTVHYAQTGCRSGLLFCSLTRPKSGSIFYFQNLSAMSDYCDKTRTSLCDAVGGQWPEIGYKLPSCTEMPLPPDTDFVISDAFIRLSDEVPGKSEETATQFLNHLAEVYKVLPKPEPEYRDWIDISKKAISDLSNNKGCWTYNNGHPYLNAYLCDYKTPAEIMVQLAVLYALREHAAWTGIKYPVVDDIADNYNAFYDEKLKTISRWLPSQLENLDHSEEQKYAMTMDSWYLHHPLLNLSRMALDGDRNSKILLMKSLEYAILVAHRFDYQWPVFYKMDTLEILKAETAEGMGGEKDVAGGYALLMINVWQLTKDSRYLNEAINAARKLIENGLDIFYQANTTAFSALALLRLYGATADETFLTGSYLCLAGIMKNVQLWECDYGNAKSFSNFFGVFPLKDAPYKAAYEEMEVYAVLNDYIKEATTMKAPILASVRMLLPEFVKYSINRLSSYYPPLLPADILSKDVKTGQVDPCLWIPVEDLQDGWQNHGQVGQEVYGAGVGFGIVPRQYVRIEGEDFMLFTDYPISRPKRSGRSIVFSTLGNADFLCNVLLLSSDGSHLPPVVLTLSKNYNDPVEPKSKSAGKIQFRIPGASVVRIKWKVK